MAPSTTLALAIWLFPVAASAENAGPPRPAAAKKTPAEQATALYASEYARSALRTDCPPVRRDEIVVCGNDRSPYRVPLPGERAPPDHARIPTGELPRAGGGGSPMPGARGVGMAIAISLGHAGQPTAPTITGLGDEKR